MDSLKRLRRVFPPSPVYRRRILSFPLPFPMFRTRRELDQRIGAASSDSILIFHCVIITNYTHVTPVVEKLHTISDDGKRALSKTSCYLPRNYNSYVRPIVLLRHSITNKLNQALPLPFVRLVRFSVRIIHNIPRFSST